MHILSMQFGIKKCGILSMETGEVIRTNGIRLLDEKDMQDIDDTDYTYLGIFETDRVKEKEMKEKSSKSICDG